MAAAEIRPFTIDIPQADLDDLQARLNRTRWAVPAGDEYGFPVSRLRRLVEYWRDGYDWHAWQARLNSCPQFVTEIGGERVHFLHVRSAEPGALPLVLTHGWPGSVVEYLDLIGPLTDPRGHGADPAQARNSQPSRRRSQSRWPPQPMATSSQSGASPTATTPTSCPGTCCPA